MHQKVAVLTDTNSGISPEEAQRLGIHLIAMPVIVDGETYFENESITQEDFFTRLRADASVSTSQPAPGVLMDCWEDLLTRYDQVLFLPMSSGLSGTCQTAVMLSQEYGGKVRVVDNHRISVTLRQSVLEALALLRQGKTAEETAEYLEKDGLNASIYIAVNTLEHLKRSGRVTAAGAAVGTILNIKPVLQIQGGKLDAYKKVRGMRAAMQAMIDGLKEDREGRFAGQKVTIRAACAGDPADGALWQAALQESFPDLEIGLDPLPISICCHTGEGALGVGLMPDIL